MVSTQRGKEMKIETILGANLKDLSELLEELKEKNTAAIKQLDCLKIIQYEISKNEITHTGFRVLNDLFEYLSAMAEIKPDINQELEKARFIASFYVKKLGFNLGN